MGDIPGQIQMINVVKWKMNTVECLQSGVYGHFEARIDFSQILEVTERGMWGNGKCLGQNVCPKVCTAFFNLALRPAGNCTTLKTQKGHMTD